jgi:MFS superfamily sulfate permease-like transporter
MRFLFTSAALQPVSHSLKNLLVMVKKPTSYLRSLGSDLPSSVVVFLVALPLCLGIAIGSGAPPFSGLIAGIVGGIVIGALSGSQLSVSGPAAGLTTIVLAAITKLQVYEAFLLAVVLAGLIQIALGFLKAGILGDYIPGAAIKGMLAAIGLILILKQIPHLVGDEADFEGDEAFQQPDGKNTFTQVFYAFKNIMPVALGIGLLSLGIMIVWEKISKKSKVLQLIPSAMIVVVTSVLINEWLKANKPDLALGAAHLVSIPKASTPREFLSFFTHPDFSHLGNIAVWTSAFTIAIIASLETLLNIEASDELDPYKRVTPTNRELKAQGMGNLVSGLIGGLPLTSVVVRTSANINSGAKTKVSAISHGVLLLACVALIPGLLSLIPFSALAAVLIFTGYKLTKPSLYTKFYKKGFDQFLPFVITVIAILVTDLLIGILIGSCIGLIFVLRSNFKSAVFVVNDENRYLFRLRKDVSFLNKPIIKRKLEEVPDNSYVLIDAARADFIDKDVIEVIEDFQKHAPLKNITVELKKSVYKEQGFASATPKELVLSKN